MVSFKGLPKGSMKGVDLAVMIYDTAQYKDPKKNEVTAVYADARVHPESPVAEGQKSLALSTRKETGKDGKERYNSNVRYTPKQIDQIKEVAGDNVAPLLNKDGETKGQIYGVKSDVFFNDGQTVMNTKTLEASDKTVQPTAEGRTIQDQIFDKQSENKAARETAAAAKGENTPEVTQEAQAQNQGQEQEAQAQADAPELG